MPNMFGGDQFDEDYAPHLYSEGRFVGEEGDRQANLDKINSVLDKLGLKDFNYEKRGYEIKGHSIPYFIFKSSNKLGEVYEDYIKIEYQLSIGDDGILFNPNQVKDAFSLSDELSDYECQQIEIPNRKSLVNKLEELVIEGKRIGQIILEG